MNFIFTRLFPLFLKEKNLFDSWEILKDKIFFYPFVKEYLELGFYLSMVFGEYEYSKKFLSILKSVIEDSEYKSEKIHFL